MTNLGVKNSYKQPINTKGFNQGDNRNATLSQKQKLGTISKYRQRKAWIILSRTVI